MTTPRSKAAQVASAIAVAMRHDGFRCTAADVMRVYETGTLIDREALASRILAAFDAYGIVCT